ncbi:fibronectin type III domain containing protein 3C1-like isoform X1 [Mustela lutreola]|uniref:fibronectin type III domain containing protein 3C1-like isoform X1 n=1 Tax=Mustela lutreola TaxID=9666 RepID=UPI002797473A|nr:fibronectin type III domain containing protein 3C1-like isoform X1 [Mustela lutreola]XP_059013824.1 fibronectin type III domain containing protein 3C1-like isoform X1 [Mustela lutreola]
MDEHGVAPTLTEIPPMASVINGEPMHQMGNYHLDNTAGTQYTTNYSQTVTHPKRYTRWPSCPQYWIQQIILVQVNPGETLTIKSDDGNIQNIQGPADVPLMSPSGTLPPIYLPPGYMSQVVEENGIRKIIIVPQTIDYRTTMPAPIPQVSHFIGPSSPMYPQGPQLMYPPVQGEFPQPYIQEPLPQQLPPPPPPPPQLPPQPLPPPQLPPPPMPPQPLPPPPMLPPQLPPAPMLPPQLPPAPMLPPQLPPPPMPPPPMPPQPLPPPPPMLPPQMPPPPMLPPATFIYQEQHEIYSHGRANYNQSDERAVNMGEHMKKKMREGQLGGHKTSYIVNTSLPMNKTNDFSSMPPTPNTYTVDYAPSTYTVDNTLSTYTVENAQHTHTVDSASGTYTVDNTTNTYTVGNVPCTYTVENTSSTNTVENTLSTYTVANAPCTYTVTSAQNIYIADNTPSTYTVDNSPSTHIANNTPSNSSTDHIPSTSTTDNALPSTTDRVSGPSSTNYVPNTSISDSTPRPSPIDSTPSSSISDHAPNTPISESVPSTSTIDGALNAASNSRTASVHFETSHGKKWSTTESGDIKQKPGGKQSKIASPNAAEKECITEHGKSCCFTIEKPVVSDIQTRSATISWKLHCSEKCDHTKSPVTFELAISNSGKNGKYKNVYVGDGVIFTLLDLQPSMAYFIRITTIRSSAHRIMSEVVSFTTPGCEPDPPLAPRLINRSKSSLNLQWKGSNDNGSKINSFLLEWDEGKSEGFKSCYMGTMKQHKILKLNASTKYSFRLAAKNNFGLSDFSEIAVFHTSGTMPPTPPPPKLKEAGICNLSLEWCAPPNPNPNDSLTYVLEMEEAGSGLGFKPKYNGEDLSCTIRNLQRSTTYKFRIFVYNLEGRSNPSGEVKYTTYPDKPGSPKTPYIKGKIYANRVKIGWEPPKDNGGTYISSYSLEVSENSDENSWNIIYNGTTKEFLYNHLQPGTTYKLRVFCTSPIGQSQPSDILTIQTPTLSPASCHPPPLNGEAKTKETNIKCDNHPNENSEAPAYAKKAEDNQDDKQGNPSSKVRCILGSHPLKCETAPVPSPPSQCGIPVLTCKGPTCVVISWVVPVCNGAEITEYRLEWGQSEESMHLIYTGPCLSYEVRSLIPATTYFCRVQAGNVVGVGPFGETGIVTTPATVPAVVPTLHEVENKVPAKLASSCIAIQWEEPDCHGSPITGYNIEYGDRKILSVERVTECILKNLQPDTTYKIRIQAINHYGLSPFSQSIRTKTKPLPLDPPHLDCVVYRHQSLKLKWGNSSSKGLHSNLISYNLLIGDRSGRFSIIYHGPCQTHKVHRLSEYTEYKFKIQACNEAGEGPLSGIYTFTTTRTPPPTLKAPKLQHVNSNICEIKWESLEPIKGDPIVYNLQLISQKGTDLIYKGPNTSFSFSNFVTNAHYRFKVCAGRQYQNSAGTQELWGPYSPSVLFSTHKQHPRPGKGGGGKAGSSTGEEKDDKPRTEMSDDTFVLILVIGFALVAILCAVIIQHFLIN